MCSLSMERMNLSGNHSGLLISRAAPVSEMFRTVHVIVVLENSMVPAFRIRRLEDMRCSSIHSPEQSECREQALLERRCDNLTSQSKPLLEGVGAKSAGLQSGSDSLRFQDHAHCKPMVNPAPRATGTMTRIPATDNSSAVGSGFRSHPTVRLQRSKWTGDWRPLHSAMHNEIATDSPRVGAAQT